MWALSEQSHSNRLHWSCMEQSQGHLREEGAPLELLTLVPLQMYAHKYIPSSNLDFDIKM